MMLLLVLSGCQAISPYFDGLFASEEDETLETSERCPLEQIVSLSTIPAGWTGSIGDTMDAIPDTSVGVLTRSDGSEHDFTLNVAVIAGEEMFNYYDYHYDTCDQTVMLQGRMTIDAGATLFAEWDEADVHLIRDNVLTIGGIIPLDDASGVLVEDEDGAIDSANLWVSGAYIEAEGWWGDIRVSIADGYVIELRDVAEFTAFP